MQALFKRFLKRFTNPQNVPGAIRLQVVTTNKIALTTLAACLPYFLIFAHFGLVEAQWATLLVAALLCVCLALSYRAEFLASRVFLCFSICLSTLIMASVFGRQANIQVCYVLALALPFVIFNRNEGRWTTACLALPLIFTGILELTGYNLVTVTSITVPEQLLTIVNISIVFTVQIIIWQMLQFFKNETDMHEDQMSISLELERALLIKERNLSHKVSQAYESIKEYMYLISHDLAAPLKHISTRLFLLKNDPDTALSQKGLEQAEKISESVDRMEGMIHSLVSYAKLEQEDLFSEEVSLEELLTSILREFETQVQEYHTTIDTPALLPTVHGNPIQLYAVFKNLIENAIKFSKKENQPRIEISYDGDLKTDFYCISIKDNGIGFDSQKAEQLFKPFKRDENSQSYKGYGMGLAIVHKIVQRHGGSIHVESTPGIGTTFSILLPKCTIRRNLKDTHLQKNTPQ